jgi:predicted GNAT family N-acyltransferase
MEIKFEQFMADDARFATCRFIRDEVFVVEQRVSPAEEWDTHEYEATHFLMLVEGAPMGTARVRLLGDMAKLERIAIRSYVRGQGLGEQLMQHLMAFVREQKGITTAKLSAQTYAIPFYEKCGFTIISDEFIDAGIPHKMMEKSLN